jgi:hypothetical protein
VPEAALAVLEQELKHYLYLSARYIATLHSIRTELQPALLASPFAPAPLAPAGKSRLGQKRLAPAPSTAPELPEQQYKMLKALQNEMLAYIAEAQAQAFTPAEGLRLNEIVEALQMAARANKLAKDYAHQLQELAEMPSAFSTETTQKLGAQLLPLLTLIVSNQAATWQVGHLPGWAEAEQGSDSFLAALTKALESKQLSPKLASNLLSLQHGVDEARMHLLRAYWRVHRIAEPDPQPGANS